jgi:mRNA-degrading endonuclease toxin of MazEF toxin-antitoxin module
VPSLDAGSVVWVECADPQGRNRKVRPVVVLTSAADIGAGKPVVAVAVTTTLPKPLPADYVPLPWSHRRHPRTGLSEPCAAVCSWFVHVPDPDAATIAGVVSGKHLREIVGKVQTLLGTEETPE